MTNKHNKYHLIVHVCMSNESFHWILIKKFVTHIMQMPFNGSFNRYEDLAYFLYGLNCQFYLLQKTPLLEVVLHHNIPGLLRILLYASSTYTSLHNPPGSIYV